MVRVIDFERARSFTLILSFSSRLAPIPTLSRLNGHENSAIPFQRFVATDRYANAVRAI